MNIAPAKLAIQLLAPLFAALLASPLLAQTRLSDGPVTSTSTVPGNLALALSVEFPTAISVAHNNATYSPTNEYIGYFDPNKCYDYQYVTDVNSVENYFQPAGLATSRTCTAKWSGNFLNWATMQTIDPFRWALTGGLRVIDEPGQAAPNGTRTVLERAWSSNQGGDGNFPNRSLPTVHIAGATPLPATSGLDMRVRTLGNKFRITTRTSAFDAEYFNNTTLNGTPNRTRAETSVSYQLVANAAAPLPSWPFFGGNANQLGNYLNTTNVSARWTGAVVAGDAGNYTFRVRADEGVRLTVTSGATTYTINQWANTSLSNYDISVPGVAANSTLSVTLEWFHTAGGSEISLQWRRPSDAGFSVIGNTLVTSTPTHYNVPANTTAIAGRLYELYARVRVCDTAASAGGVEANCTRQPNGNYKPTGLIQEYSDRMRFAAFGYLNDGAITRDGGVLRARMKYVGPTQPVPNGEPIASPNAEWNGNTGVFVKNPNASEADDASIFYGVTDPNAATRIQNSGVINYLNKFGQDTQSYKTFDPVSELHYAALRYFSKKGNVTEWTAKPANAATALAQADGFPVITDWYKDAHEPILYQCQRNFILGIGDVNTHADRNLPGSSTRSATNEPTVPSAVSGDTLFSADTFTNYIGTIEALTSPLLSTRMPYGGCCNENGPLMAGMAYQANVSDIRPDMPGTQTVQTYWMDVLENSVYKQNNQFYLAAKYGAFRVPQGFDPATRTTALPKSWWARTNDLTPSPQQSRPDSYYTASSPKAMVDGLATLFNNINISRRTFSSSFASSVPQVDTQGDGIYASTYNMADITGEITASQITFNDPNRPAIPPTPDTTSVLQWTFSDKLGQQAAGTGWNTGRRIVTLSGSAGVPFRSTNPGISAAQLALLDTAYDSRPDGAKYLDYLRGDRSNELSATPAAVSPNFYAYRDRIHLVGDIVNGRVKAVPPPSAPLGDSFNPGYAAFRDLYNPAPTVPPAPPAVGRPPILLAGTNQGMLHVINGSLTGADAGKEFFAYVPAATFSGPTGNPAQTGLQALGNPEFQHFNFVDAQPAVMDIDMARTAGSNLTSPTWRTIAVGGLGSGGKALYALDITNPSLTEAETVTATRVLWEISSATPGYEDLGFQTIPPAIFKTAKHGWVVVIGSGHNSRDGKAIFYFINPRTGALLEKAEALNPETGLSFGSTASPSGMAAISAFIPDARDGTADSIYAGDLLGNLWRLSVRSTDPLPAQYPAPKLIAKLRDPAGQPLPVTARPLVVIHPDTRARWITVGTGRWLHENDKGSPQVNRFFAIIDGLETQSFEEPASPTPYPLPNGWNYPITTARLKPLDPSNLREPTRLDLSQHIGWYLDLGATSTTANWRVISDSTAFFGNVAFASVIPAATDPCNPSGNSRLYVINLGTGLSGLLSRPPFKEIGGIVTDVRFLSVDGRVRIAIGTDTGENSTPRLEDLGTLKLKRMNWREVPQSN